MKLCQIFIFSIFFFSSLLLPTTILAIDGHLNVTSPSGGEVWREGETHTISWDASDNIDKVSIMYKSDEHHGNWVEFSQATSGSGSYSWNVDVGNTTNTQFYIQITGYETGTGSTSNFSPYLTINQKDDAPPKPDPTPTPTPAPTSTPASTPAPTQTPTTGYTYTAPKISFYNTWLSITNITIWNIFSFEGSDTTDLDQVENPQQVDDFLLDTELGFEFLFLDTLDMTDQDTLKAISSIEDYWVVEGWFFWIQWEWWEDYELDSPIVVTYQNDQLTEFTPTVIDQDEKPSSYEVLGSSSDGLSLRIDGGAKLSIEPNVVLGGDDELTCHVSPCIVQGQTSHKDLNYSLKLNGKESDIAPLNFDSQSGNFDLELPGLVEGANYAEFSYQLDDNESVQFGAKTIYFRPSLWHKYQSQILTGLGLIAALAAGIALGVYAPIIKKKSQALLDSTQKLLKSKLNPKTK